MNFRKSIQFVLILACGFALLPSGSAFAAAQAAQTSESDGVTIKVRPVDISAGVATWNFEVSMDTHSGMLGDDLARSAYILDRTTKSKLLPTEWAGDAPGGHHRKGVLRFKALKPMPKAIELRIQRAGEKAPRVFRWDLDCPCNDPKMHAT